MIKLIHFRNCMRDAKSKQMDQIEEQNESNDYDH